MELNFKTAVGGQHIDDFIKEMIAGGCNCAITGEFNGTKFEVIPGDTFDKVKKRYKTIRDKQQEAYFASDEYKQKQSEQKIRENANTALVNELLQEAKQIDWSNIPVVLEFLNRTVDPFGYTYTDKFAIATIKDHLVDAGYIAGEKTGENFNGEDKENSGRYLIGQALDCVQNGWPILDVYSRMYSQWVEKWGDN